jgi:hypothetical protein
MHVEVTDMILQYNHGNLQMAMLAYAARDTAGVQADYKFSYYIYFLDFVDFGPGSPVGIATDYGLDCPGIESRWG